MNAKVHFDTIEKAEYCSIESVMKGSAEKAEQNQPVREELKSLSMLEELILLAKK